jgi:hypothetical protein
MMLRREGKLNVCSTQNWFDHALDACRLRLHGGGKLQPDTSPSLALNASASACRHAGSAIKTRLFRLRLRSGSR